MKVKLLTQYAGPRGTFSPGEKDLPKDIAVELVKAGFALPIRGIQYETATIQPPETTAHKQTMTLPRGRRRK